jgi:hypothetical protein
MQVGGVLDSDSDHIMELADGEGEDSDAENHHNAASPIEVEDEEGEDAELSKPTLSETMVFKTHRQQQNDCPKIGQPPSTHSSGQSQ